MLGCVWLAGRGSRTARLLWPGALFYCAYNYIAYSAASLPVWQAGFYLALAVLSAAAIFVLLRSMDGEIVVPLLRGKVPERLAGGILAGLGLLFFLRAVGQVAGGLVALDATQLTSLVADLLATPFWVVGGVLLWLKRPLGYLGAI